MDICKFLIAMFSLLGVLMFCSLVETVNDSMKRQEEWNQKVNNCVMDSNYRPDCKLILYKDQQITATQGQNYVMVTPVYTIR